MFGPGEKKRITVVAFAKGGDASVASRAEGEFTKEEVLGRIGKWWDNQGTGIDDYDSIQITVAREDRHVR